MAAMIDAKDAKAILGCDDETLNGHINRGAIRAQRSGGKLSLNAEDVQKLSLNSDDEDGTIVLTGDSDNLQIDLGSVIDDTTATNATNKPKASTATSSDALTFGDELEVINFEDSAPAAKRDEGKPLKFDEASNTVDMSFTDQNTAVMSSVDQTAMGTTAPLEYNTGSNDGPATTRADSSRRSVRSNRVRVEAPPIHWGWALCMTGTTLVLGLLVLPYYILAAWPIGEERDARGDRKRGADDTFFTSIASTVAGFSVEPDQAQFKRMNGEAEFADMKNHDTQAEWRYVKYRGEFKDVAAQERAKTFQIDKISDDGKSAISVGAKKTYPVVEVKTGEIVDEVVDLGFGK